MTRSRPCAAASVRIRMMAWAPENRPSQSVCRKLGFTYWKQAPIRVCDWLALSNRATPAAFPSSRVVTLTSRVRSAVASGGVGSKSAPPRKTRSVAAKLYRRPKLPLYARHRSRDRRTMTCSMIALRTPPAHSDVGAMFPGLPLLLISARHLRHRPDVVSPLAFWAGPPSNGGRQAIVLY